MNRRVFITGLAATAATMAMPSLASAKKDKFEVVRLYSRTWQEDQYQEGVWLFSIQVTEYADEDTAAEVVQYFKDDPIVAFGESISFFSEEVLEEDTLGDSSIIYDMFYKAHDSTWMVIQRGQFVYHVFTISGEDEHKLDALPIVEELMERDLPESVESAKDLESLLPTDEDIEALELDVESKDSIED